MSRLALLLLTMSAFPALAFEPVKDRARFVDLVAGRELSLPVFKVRLQVAPDGTITGSAMGWAVVGHWDWQDGYFCREMDWSGTPIPPTCQLVEVEGERLRFTVDRGTGQSATFRLN